MLDINISGGCFCIYRTQLCTYNDPLAGFSIILWPSTYPSIDPAYLFTMWWIGMPSHKAAQQPCPYMPKSPIKALVVRETSCNFTLENRRMQLFFFFCEVFKWLAEEQTAEDTHP